MLSRKKNIANELSCLSIQCRWNSLSSSHNLLYLLSLYSHQQKLIVAIQTLFSVKYEYPSMYYLFEKQIVFTDFFHRPFFYIWLLLSTNWICTKKIIMTVYSTGICGTYGARCSRRTRSWRAPASPPSRSSSNRSPTKPSSSGSTSWTSLRRFLKLFDLLFLESQLSDAP